MNQIITHLKKLTNKKPEKKSFSNIPITLNIQNLAGIKRVTKPWGFELWLADAADTPYSLKLIYLKKGTKTSLQYHKEKSEHNCIFTGKVKFYYQDTATNKIEFATLGSGHVTGIQPQVVHRIEALTDTILIEASTHHLDDVVRLEDDFGRPDGKIEAEHNI